MKRGLIVVALFAVFITSCGPSQADFQNAVVATIASIPTNTPYPSSTPLPTYTPYPTQTAQPTIMVTKVIVQTPTPHHIDDDCKPIDSMDYSDNSKAAIKLQSYVADLPGVRQVSYVIPEKLYSNTLSQLYYVRYIEDDDGKLYSKRYIVYMREFGWENKVFSIDGQCWID